MPRTAPQRKAKPKHQRGAGPVAKVQPSPLILDCDPAPLPERTASFGDELEAAVGISAPRARRLRIRAGTTAELLSDLGAAKTAVGHFDLIVVIGHSNERKLALTRDGHVTWSAVARWLAPFCPKKIILVACEAGRWVPGAALFEGIPSLRDVYGSPVLVNDLHPPA